MRNKEYRSEEEILFQGANTETTRESFDTFKCGTTFAGSGKVCSKSLTPNPAKARRLRTQKYW